MKHHVCHPLLASLVLYLLGISGANLSYLDLSQGLYNLLLSVLLCITGFLTVITLIYGVPAALKIILRAAILQLGFWGCFLTDSLIGITRLFVPMDSENYAWGLLFLSFWWVLSATSVLTILGAVITQTVKKHRSK